MFEFVKVSPKYCRSLSPRTRCRTCCGSDSV